MSGNPPLPGRSTTCRLEPANDSLSISYGADAMLIRTQTLSSDLIGTLALLDHFGSYTKTNPTVYVGQV
jgi:hypothetical protein